MITLLIKRKFLNAIKIGTKKYEYRDKIPYYDKLFSKSPTQVQFLCQYETLIRPIKKIDVCWGKYRLHL